MFGKIPGVGHNGATRDGQAIVIRIVVQTEGYGEGRMFLRFVNKPANGKSQAGVILDEFPIDHQPVCLDKTARIRPYQPADRESIRRLCCETGYLGDPVESLFQDRELFADLFTNAYLDHAPEWAFVAEVDGRVVGYLLGAISPRFELALMRSGLSTTAKMLYRLATGRYAQHPRSRRFVRWLLTSGFREQPRHPANAAHLHWDLSRGFRGRGICLRLWQVYERRLRAAGVQECYGSFFSYNKRRPESVYARYGFRVFDRKRTTIFEPEIPDPVEIVCVNRKL